MTAPPTTAAETTPVPAAEGEPEPVTGEEPAAVCEARHDETGGSYYLLLLLAWARQCGWHGETHDTTLVGAEPAAQASGSVVYFCSPLAKQAVLPVALACWDRGVATHAVHAAGARAQLEVEPIEATLWALGAAARVELHESLVRLPSEAAIAQRRHPPLGS